MPGRTNFCNLPETRLLREPRFLGQTDRNLASRLQIDKLQNCHLSRILTTHHVLRLSTVPALAVPLPVVAPPTCWPCSPTACLLPARRSRPLHGAWLRHQRRKVHSCPQRIRLGAFRLTSGFLLRRHRPPRARLAAARPRRRGEVPRILASRKLFRSISPTRARAKCYPASRCRTDAVCRLVVRNSAAVTGSSHGYLFAAICSAVMPMRVGGPRVLAARPSRVPLDSKYWLMACISALRRVKAVNTSLVIRSVYPRVVTS